MARRPVVSQQRQIKALLAAHEPRIRAAFEAAIRAAGSSVDFSALVAAIEQFNATRDASQVVALMKINQAALFPLDDAIRAAFVAGGASVMVPRSIAGSFGFSGRHPRAEKIISEIGARMVSEIGAPDPEAIRAILLNGAEQGRGAARVARDLAGTINRATGSREGGIIGLDGPRARQAAKVREILSNPARIDEYFIGNSPRFTSTDRRFDAAVRKAMSEGRALSPDQVDKVSRAHEARLLKARGKTIAQNEAFTAQAMGRHEAYKQMSSRNDVEVVLKKWQHGFSRKPRPDHIRMDGEVRGLDEFFVMDDLTPMSFPHDPAGGADHSVNCRCTVVYIPQFVKD